MSCTIQGGAPLKGTIKVPPSKSHSMRALFLGGLASGVSKIDNLLDSPDVHGMRQAIAQIGAYLTPKEGGLAIRGVSGRPLPGGVIDGGNSGQILRFVGACCALANGATLLTGDHSLKTQRPVAPLLHGIRQLGGSAYSVMGKGAPIFIRGPIKAGEVEVEGADSQPVSALLMVMSLLNGKSRLLVQNPGETPWVQLTLDWLQELGAKITHKDYQTFEVVGGELTPFTKTIPGDYSSALYPMAASLVTGSSLEVTGLDPDDGQGDKLALTVARQMATQSGEIDVNPFIDALPLLAVLGCYTPGKTILRGGAIARKKECDRISAIASELKKMGARITELPDGLIIEEGPLHGAHVSTYKDHRLALSLAVAAMGAKGKTHIEDPGIVAKSYPNFWEEMRRVGCQIL